MFNYDSEILHFDQLFFFWKNIFLAKVDKGDVVGAMEPLAQLNGWTKKMDGKNHQFGVAFVEK